VGFGTQNQCLCLKNSFRVIENQSLGIMLWGEYCEDIDECAEGKCRRGHKMCVNTIGSYNCSCERYEMNRTGDCITLYSDVNCGHGVRKESGNNGFLCQCDDGYGGENCITRANSKLL
jgi:hypothetical protein